MVHKDAGQDAKEKGVGGNGADLEFVCLLVA